MLAILLKKWELDEKALKCNDNGKVRIMQF